MTTDKVTTKERIIEAMKIRHMNQADIVRKAQPFCEAHGLKMNKSDVSQFVSGKVIPSQWKVSILADALNVNEAWLMGYDVPMDRYVATENAPDSVRELDEYIVQQLTSVTDTRLAFVLEFLKLPEAQAQRVMDFLAGLKAAEQA